MLQYASAQKHSSIMNIWGGISPCWIRWGQKPPTQGWRFLNVWTPPTFRKLMGSNLGRDLPSIQGLAEKPTNWEKHTGENTTSLGEVKKKIMFWLTRIQDYFIIRLATSDKMQTPGHLIEGSARLLTFTVLRTLFYAPYLPLLLLLV